jgi:4'-phosphopantetheinyl transferase EntD
MEVWPDICTPAELDWVGSLPADSHQEAAALIFSAKEAFYKCQFPVFGRELDFQEVELGLDRLAPEPGRFAIRVLTDSGPPFENPSLCFGAYCFDGPLILAGYTLLAG